MREAERTAEQAAAIDHNRRAWDHLAADGVPLARPATDEAFGDPRGWLGSAGSAARPWLPTRLAGLDVLYKAFCLPSRTNLLVCSMEWSPFIFVIIITIFVHHFI